MSDDAPNPTGDAGRDVWPEPAPASDEDAVTQVPLDKGGDLNPWAAPGDAEQSGPGHTVVSGEPVSPAARATPQDQAPPPSVHDQRTVVSLPDASSPPPADSTPPAWASPFAPPVNGALGSYPPPNPATAAGGPPPPNPFAPPAVHQTGPVPPPPISPDGPGQVPYGYPGGYGYPAHPQVPYGWPGAPRVEQNGMGITSMVLGIVSAVGFCLWPLAIVLGILAVVFGVIGRKKAKRGEASNPGQALAGIICGAAGFALGTGLISLIAFLPS
ncbi:DUF4190 domain-containing protein [Streptomyces sp. NPDC002920]